MTLSLSLSLFKGVPVDKTVPRIAGQKRSCFQIKAKLESN